MSAVALDHYHHFGSKQGLYAVVREELERRVVDRMDGAASFYASMAFLVGPPTSSTGWTMVRSHRRSG